MDADAPDDPTMLRAENEKLARLVQEQQAFMAYQQQRLDEHGITQEEDPYQTILPRKEKTATTELGRSLIAMVQWPPPLDRLSDMIRDTPVYAGMPQTASMGQPSGELFHITRKLECALNLMVSQAEQPANAALLRLIMATVRSAHEDIWQMRRKAEAQGRQHLLDPRIDQLRTDILSEEERKRIGRAQPSQNKGRGRSRSRRNSAPSQSYAQQQHAQGRGRGRARGRGRGRGRKSSASSK